MSQRVKDLDLSRTLHLQWLPDPPAGLRDQLSELDQPVARFEAARATILHDANLTDAGKKAALQTVRDTETAVIAAWTAAKTGGIDAQIAAEQRTLGETAALGVVGPTELQVRMLVGRLVDLDPLQVEMLYLDGDESERIAIERAVEQLGRIPRQRPDGSFVWETLLAPERIAQVQAARAERAAPAASAAVKNLERIRNTYQAMSSTALSLLED